MLNLFVTTISGAGDGNRTHTASLEGWNSTIELHPHCGTINKIISNYFVNSAISILFRFINIHNYVLFLNKMICFPEPFKWWREKDSNLRTLTRADLQSAAIDHSATPPKEPYCIK